MAYKMQGQNRFPQRNGRFPDRTPRDKAEMERLRLQHEDNLGKWVPKTKLGRLVKEKKLKNIDEALKYRILEPEITDSLLPLRADILNIGQSKGKFGGGKRRAWRQTQRKTKEGNRPTFSGLVAIGDGKGHIGIGHGKSNETLPARNKAIRSAKLNVIKI